VYTSYTVEKGGKGVGCMLVSIYSSIGSFIVSLNLSEYVVIQIFVFGWQQLPWIEDCTTWLSQQNSQMDLFCISSLWCYLVPLVNSKLHISFCY